MAYLALLPERRDKVHGLVEPNHARLQRRIQEGEHTGSQTQWVNVGQGDVV